MVGSWLRLAFALAAAGPVRRGWPRTIQALRSASRSSRLPVFQPLGRTIFCNQPGTRRGTRKHFCGESFCRPALPTPSPASPLPPPGGPHVAPGRSALPRLSSPHDPPGHQQNRRAVWRVLCRDRRRRQPPKLSAPLGPARAAIFEGAPMTLRDISMHENRRALPLRVSRRPWAAAASEPCWRGPREVVAPQPGLGCPGDFRGSVPPLALRTSRPSALRCCGLSAPPLLRHGLGAELA
jgi:hypothetical protein